MRVPAATPSRVVKTTIDSLKTYDRLIVPRSWLTLLTTVQIIQYGYLMLFAAAFPLAPLVAILTNQLDMYMDSHRLLWRSRRPIAQVCRALRSVLYLDIRINGFGSMT